METVDKAKVDLHVTENEDLVCLSDLWFDTLVGVWMINENLDKGLKDITKEVYKVNQMTYKELIATVDKEIKLKHGFSASAVNGVPISLTSIKECAPYAISDAYWTRLHKRWIVKGLKKDVWKEDKESGEKVSTLKFFRDYMMPFLISTYEMERRGVRIDENRIQEMKNVAEKAIEDYKFRLIKLAGIQLDLSSPQQIAELLFGYKKMSEVKVKAKKAKFKTETVEKIVNGKKVKEKIKVEIAPAIEASSSIEFVGNKFIVEASFGLQPAGVSEKTGQPSVGEDAYLEILKTQHYPAGSRKAKGIEFLKVYKEYQKVEKIKGTYIDGIMNQIYPDGKVHPKFNVGQTVTGRLSSSEPNFQNLVRPVELNPPYMGKFVKEGYDINISKLAKYIKFKTDMLGVIEDAEWKYPVPQSFREGFELKKFIKEVTKWRKSKEFDFLMKEIEIRSLVIPDRPDEEVIIALDCV